MPLSAPCVLCSWAPLAPAWVLSPSSSSLSKEGRVSHTNASSPLTFLSVPLATGNSKLCCTRWQEGMCPAGLFTQPPQAASACPQLLNLLRGFNLQGSVATSGLCLQLRTLGCGVNHQPPFSMDTLISERGTPGSPLLSHDAGGTPLRGEERENPKCSLPQISFHPFGNF